MCINFIHISVYANIIVCVFDRASHYIYVDILHTISIKKFIYFHKQASKHKAEHLKFIENVSWTMFAENHLNIP